MLSYNNMQMHYGGIFLMNSDVELIFYSYYCAYMFGFIAVREFFFSSTILNFSNSLLRFFRILIFFFLWYFLNDFCLFILFWIVEKWFYMQNNNGKKKGYYFLNAFSIVLMNFISDYFFSRWVIGLCVYDVLLLKK